MDTCNSSRKGSVSLAFALVLLKSKPAMLSVEDYILCLRKTLKLANPNSSNLEQNIDSAVFWKHAFERSEWKRQRTESMLLELERRENPVQIPSKMPTGRKRQASATANTQAKRFRSHSEVTDEHALWQFDDTIPEMPKGSSELLHAIRILCHTRDKSNLSATKVVDTIRSACSTVADIIPEMCKLSIMSTDKGTGTRSMDLSKILMKVITTVVQAVPSIDSSQRAYIQTCTANIVLVVQVILGQLHQVCLDQADKKKKLAEKKSKKAKSNTKVTQDNFREQTARAEELCQELTRLAVVIMNTIQLDCEQHQSVFEGIMCAFLDHLGSSMSMALFGDSDAKINGSGVCPPCGLVDVSHIGVDDAINTTRIEAPYLVRILKAASRHTHDPWPGNRAFEGTSNRLELHLLSDMQSRLQSTLLRGIFGDDDDGIGCPLFRPVPGDVVLPEECKQKSDSAENPSEWFLSQVWDVIGWDVLMNAAQHSINT